MSRARHVARRPPAPAQARFLADLSPAMGKALVRCDALVVAVAKGPEAFGIAQQTLDALLRHGLVAETTTKKRGTKVWRPTANGHRVLSAEEPRLLAARSDALYTTELGEAMRDDPGEAVDEISQRLQTADARDRSQGSPGRRLEALQREALQLSRRLREEVRSVDVADIAVVAQLERIRTEVARLEELRAA